MWEAGTGSELLTLRGHQDYVWSIAWSPDGSKLATACGDRTAKVWKVVSGAELVSLRGHQDSVQNIAWSPDGSKLATASDDRTAKVWEASTGRELLTVRGQAGRGARCGTQHVDLALSLLDEQAGFSNDAFHSSDRHHRDWMLGR